MHLQSPGYEVTLASAGEEELQKAAEGDFELISTDMMMPRIDGFQVVQTLGQRPDTAATPIIFLTAKALRQTSSSATSPGRTTT